jgi:alcohol dehydrogenase YqhD (iron-dependent ADH family)
MAQEFLKTLHSRGKEALSKVVDRILSVLKPRETRAIRDIAENVRDFFHNLGINVRERYADFAEWLSGVWQQGVGHAKGKIAQLKEIAREVTDHAKEMHKETVREAIEALRPFRDQLGDMWRELLDAGRDALKGKEQ